MKETVHPTMKLMLGRIAAGISVWLMLTPAPVLAGASARLETPATEAWTGQRIPIYIELRAPGSFDGAPSFDIPRMPHSVVIKIGSPVLGSVTEGETEYLTQRHEFALFSQAQGEIKLPPITARFAHKVGYSGPSSNATETVPAASFNIRRPPGSEQFGFLVTTESLEIEERWEPEPGPVETGAVFKRTIVQKAAELTGIALCPAPSTEIEGIRTYPGEPGINDRTERGRLSGERSETLTYLVREPGLHTLPAIRFDWWNPKTETLESFTLPAVSFTATAPPLPPPKPAPARLLWFMLPLALILPVWWFRTRIVDLCRWLRNTIDPPADRAVRKFLRACRHNDPIAAIRLWAVVRRVRPNLVVTAELNSQILALHRRIYGPGEKEAWSGRNLAAAFREMDRKSTAAPTTPLLPPLNP